MASPPSSMGTKLSNLTKKISLSTSKLHRQKSKSSLRDRPEANIPREPSPPPILPVITSEQFSDSPIITAFAQASASLSSPDLLSQFFENDSSLLAETFSSTLTNTPPNLSNPGPEDLRIVSRKSGFAESFLHGLTIRSTKSLTPSPIAPTALSTPKLASSKAHIQHLESEIDTLIQTSAALQSEINALHADLPLLESRLNIERIQKDAWKREAKAAKAQLLILDERLRQADRFIEAMIALQLHIPVLRDAADNIRDGEDAERALVDSIVKAGSSPGSPWSRIVSVASRSPSPTPDLNSSKGKKAQKKMFAALSDIEEEQSEDGSEDTDALDNLLACLIEDETPIKTMEFQEPEITSLASMPSIPDSTSLISIECSSGTTPFSIPRDPENVASEHIPLIEFDEPKPVIAQSSHMSGISRPAFFNVGGNPNAPATKPLYKELKPHTKEKRSESRIKRKGLMLKENTTLPLVVSEKRTISRPTQLQPLSSSTFPERISPDPFLGQLRQQTFKSADSFPQTAPKIPVPGSRRSSNPSASFFSSGTAGPRETQKADPRRFGGRASMKKYLASSESMDRLLPARVEQEGCFDLKEEEEPQVTFCPSPRPPPREPRITAHHTTSVPSSPSKIPVKSSYPSTSAGPRPVSLSATSLLAAANATNSPHIRPRSATPDGSPISKQFRSSTGSSHVPIMDSLSFKNAGTVRGLTTPPRQGGMKSFGSGSPGSNSRFRA